MKYPFYDEKGVITPLLEVDIEPAGETRQDHSKRGVFHALIPISQIMFGKSGIIFV